MQKITYQIMFGLLFVASGILSIKYSLTNFQLLTLVILQFALYSAMMSTKYSPVWTGYMIIGTSVLLNIWKVISIDWTLIGFVACALIFWFSKTDARYLLVLALLGLMYCPFALSGGFTKLAEIVAVYVYYALVCGVLLQIVETYSKSKIILDFIPGVKQLFASNYFTAPAIVSVVVSVCIFIFTKINAQAIVLARWNIYYVTVLLLIGFFIQYTLKKGYYEA